MILAGLDEAGLGPFLGPLVVAMSALRVPEQSPADCPWSALESVLASKPQRGDDRMLVGDSKVVYRARGMAGLEQTVLAFLLATETEDQPAPTLRMDLLRRLGADRFLDAALRIPWFRDDTPLSRAVADTACLERSRALGRALEAAGIDPVYLRASAWPAMLLNEAFAEGHNKAEVVWHIASELIRSLHDAFPGESIHLVLDRQGGRMRYHPLLTDLFPGEWVDILEERPARSAYRVRRTNGDLVIDIQPRADSSAFCVALASLVAKFVRETCMEAFNRYFRERLPELQPTAGYPTDAKRFLAESAAIIEDERIPIGLLRRTR